MPLSKPRTLLVADTYQSAMYWAKQLKLVRGSYIYMSSEQRAYALTDKDVDRIIVVGEWNALVTLKVQALRSRGISAHKFVSTKPLLNKPTSLEAPVL